MSAAAPVPAGGQGLPSVTVIIPVRDDATRLARCLESVAQDAYPGDRRVLVADNGSRDGSAEVARRSGARVLDLPGLSVAQLRNRAAGEAATDILAFIDADHTIAAGWLVAATSSLAAEGVGAAGMAYVTPEHATWVQRAYDRFRSRPRGVADTNWLGSGNLAVWKHAFDRVGGFDTTLETCEDVDLCNRLRRAGYRLLSDDRMRSVHFGDPATLRALFAGELWRGRDNIRVTLRGPLGLGALPSVVIPVVNLASVAASLAGALAAPWGGLGVSAACLALIALTIALRAVRMTRHDEAPARWRRFPENAAVACAYELGRALALVVRATHRTRRERAGA